VRIPLPNLEDANVKIVSGVIVLIGFVTAPAGQAFADSATIAGLFSQMPESAVLVLSGLVMFLLARGARQILSVAKIPGTTARTAPATTTHSPLTGLTGSR